MLTDLAVCGTTGAGSGAVEQNPDAPNQMLLSIMLDQLSVLHDRELPLSDADSERFMQHLRDRKRPSSAPSLPLPSVCSTKNISQYGTH